VNVGLVGLGRFGKLHAAVLSRLPQTAGVVRMGHGVQAAYFSQHEVELDERGSVLDCAMHMTGLRRQEAQSLLGRFLFSGWDAHEKPVVALSGGERRRLALASVVASGANFLVLDEPTNHLDLESRESLEAALEAFPGTILLVSHDRALLDAVAERTLAVEALGLNTYEGGWADYLRLRAEREQAAAAVPPARAAVKPRKPRPERPKRARPTPLELVEAEIQRKEAAVAELERRLAENWSDTELLTAHREARAELGVLLERWEKLFETSETPSA